MWRHVKNYAKGAVACLHQEGGITGIMFGHQTAVVKELLLRDQNFGVFFLAFFFGIFFGIIFLSSFFVVIFCHYFLSLFFAIIFCCHLVPR